jgi:hypothetical protein
VLDDQLAAVAEQPGQRDRSLRALEDVLLLDPDHGQLAPLGVERAVSAGLILPPGLRLSILGFETEGTVPQAGTNAGPALAFAGSSTDGTLYLGFKGRTNDDFGYEAIFNVAESGLALSNWTPQEFD